MITITKDEAIGLADLLECCLFDLIRNDVDIDSMEWLCDMTSLWKKCKAAEEEPDGETEQAAPMTGMAEAAEKFMSVINEVTEQEKAEPPKPVFYGSRAEMKRGIHAKLTELRASGMTSGEISRMTGGKVTPDEILLMLAAGKVPFSKWEALEAALFGEAQ